MDYEDLTRAAKELRVDPARYQPVAGIEFETGARALYRWQITPDDGPEVVGLLGVHPIDELIPHEATTAAALTRPRHPVQIRPVMALVDSPLPSMRPIGSPRVFIGTHRHSVVPVETEEFDTTGAVIADGHHRTAAARRTGGDPGIMTLVVSTAAATLEAGSFHRVFANPVRLPASLDGVTLIDEPPSDSLAAGRIAVVTPRRSCGLVFDRVPPELDGLPAGLVHSLVLPALGLDERDAVYLDDVDAAVSAAQYGTALLLPGSSLDAVVRAARSGVALPPKATRFRPKPMRGLVMRRL